MTLPVQGMGHSTPCRVCRCSLDTSLAWQGIPSMADGEPTGRLLPSHPVSLLHVGPRWLLSPLRTSERPMGVTI